MFMEENLNQVRRSCGSTHLVRPNYASQKVRMRLNAFSLPFKNSLIDQEISQVSC